MLTKEVKLSMYKTHEFYAFSCKGCGVKESVLSYDFNHLTPDGFPSRISPLKHLEAHRHGSNYRTAISSEPNARFLVKSIEVT